MYPVRICTLALLLGGLAAAAWLPPENLGATLNTTYDEWYPVASPDGDYMIFTSDRPGGQGNLDLWRSRRNAGGDWQTPENLGANVNTTSWESGHFITADGRYLYFASNCAGSEGYGDIWYCELTNGVPGPKVNLGPPINSPYLDCCPAITADGNTLYFGSDRAGGYGQDDIWVSVKSGGAWGQPVNLGDVVNTSGNECPRWVSADGQTLVFISSRSGGYGLHDLWYTTKVGNAWTAPVNLGPNVNSAAEDWGASFDCNHGELGGVIFFGSGRDGGVGGMDLWRSTDSASIRVDDATLGEIKAAYQ